MSIEKIIKPIAGFPETDDWVNTVAHLQGYTKQVNGTINILTNVLVGGEAATVIPKIGLGAYIAHKGELYIVVGEDYTIQGTTGQGQNYIAVEENGDVLEATWTQSLAGFDWVPEFNQVYDTANEKQILPYYVRRENDEYSKAIILAGNIHILGDVDGNTLFKDAVQINQELLVKGSSDFEDNVVMRINLDVEGSLNVDGSMTLGGSLSAGGNISTDGSITAVGNITGDKVYGAVFS